MFEPRAVGGYEALQLSTSLRLLVDPVKTPERFYEHFLRFLASLVLTLSFCCKDLDEDMNTGAHLVDKTFLALDSLPDFLSQGCAEARKKGSGEVEVRQFGLRILA
ncbi:hypothetical protein B0H14DRAFT_3540854 [Mycena olivaceomarginata]|nr:hypothetical protein B0H14DRAFT_3540854 [Mycena olivaceomarginata]